MADTEHVARDYAAHEDREDILYGKDLQDGMIVLLEEPLLRMGDRADEVARWCEVTRYELIETRDWPMIRFVARYADGTLRVRTYPASTPWIVQRKA
jgi:hypothetical protein